MSAKLGKLLASPNTARAERTVEICLAQGIPSQVGALVVEVEDLKDDLEELQIEAHRKQPEEGSGQAQRKMAEGHDPRIDELKAQIGTLTAEISRLNDIMREHTGRLTVAQTISQGDWRRWADDNPAREDGRDASGRPLLSPYDITVVGGYCNATALLARLGDFVTAWDGEPLEDGQWAQLAAKAHPGDLKSAATAVVGMYEGEGAKALPKSSIDSFGTLPTGIF